MSTGPERVDWNVENEQTVVASLLQDAPLRARWTPELAGSDFVGARHRVLLEVARELDRQGLSLAEDTVDLLAAGREYGGVKYLRELLAAYRPNPNLELHVGRLRRDTARHQLLTGPLARARTLAADPHAPDEDLSTALQEAGLLLSPAADRRPRYGRVLIDGYKTRLRERPGLSPFHFKALDEKLTAGLAPKKVSVVAGRPGMGKSTFVANLVLRQARRKKRVLVLPVERGEDSLVDGMVCARARLRLERLVKDPGTLTPEEWKLLETATEDLFADEYIHILDRRVSLDELEALLVHGAYDLVVIDLWEKLLKNLEAQRIAEALNRAQDLAHRAGKGKGTHLMLFHQIRRGTEKAKNHRPSLEMLKNSGGYEEVADLILLLHREKYYEPTLERDVLEVACAKQTQGTTGWAVAYEFIGEESRVGAHVPDWFETLDDLLPPP